MMILEKILSSLFVSENLARSGRNFVALENEVNAKLGDGHNTDATAHDDIRGQINNLDAQKANQANLNATNNIVAIKADKSYVDTITSSLASGSPKAVATVAEMTDTTKNYVYTGVEEGYTSGNWYYYNGSAWVSGGTYQTTGISDGSVSEKKLEPTLSSKINTAIERESNNLYDKALAINGKLISYTTWQLTNYADSILSGWVPIEEGKTYAIKNGDALYVGAIAFVKEVSPGTFERICAQSNGTNAYGASGDYWPVATGLVDITWKTDRTSVVVSILPNSGITHAIWYITKLSSTNYYGPHTSDEFLSAISSVQMNLGNEILQFDEYSKSFIAKGLQEAVDRITNTENQIAEIAKRPVNGVAFIKSGNDVQFRSKWTDELDIINSARLTYGTNNLFNLRTLFTIDKSVSDNIIADEANGTVFKGMGDDICPAYFNGSYLGANHGYFAGWTITLTAHGKTTADIGSVWTDANGKDYIILQIASTSTLFISSDFTGNNFAPLSTTAPVAPLTHKSGATNTGSIPFTSISSLQQITPAVNNRTVKVMINGDTEFDINTNSYANGEFVDVVEEYNIIDVSKMINYLKANVGNNANLSLCSDLIDKYCTVCMIYRFHDKGICTVYQTIDFKPSVNISNIGFIQSIAVGDDLYVPMTSYKNITTQGVSTVDLAKVTWDLATVPPNRYFQFNTDKTKGFVIGYCPEYGYGVAEKRIAKINATAGVYNGSTHKNYPYLINSGVVEAGSTFDAICFRVPIQQYDAEFTNISWYWVGDDIYLMLDTHKNIDKHIALPSYMNGRKITIVEKSASVTIPYSFVSANGIKIKITDNYGSAILKLSK